MSRQVFSERGPWGFHICQIILALRPFKKS